ncbi:hypothetical protein, partial [Escherichia coli]|uniref:hypothetical protein n=1 Tax=Escherichia coli TaxID=562 RepID=UPI0010CC364B
GGMTVTDPDSIGILIDGDKGIVNNAGDNDISNGGTGTQIKVQQAPLNNDGNTTVAAEYPNGTAHAANTAVENPAGSHGAGRGDSGSHARGEGGGGGRRGGGG